MLHAALIAFRCALCNIHEDSEVLHYIETHFSGINFWILFFHFFLARRGLKPVISSWFMMHKCPGPRDFSYKFVFFFMRASASTTETVTSESLFYSLHIMLLNLLSASLFLFAFTGVQRDFNRFLTVNLFLFLPYCNLSFAGQSVTTIELMRSLMEII